MNQARRWDSPHLAGFPSKSTMLESDKEALRAYLECSVLSCSKLSPYFNPIAFSLLQFDWAVIGHGSFEKDFLTLKSDESERLRQREFTRMLGVVCSLYKLRINNLLFYCKSEWGLGGRGHIHFLIGRRGTEAVSPIALASTMYNIWFNGPFRRGVAEIQPFQKENLYEAVLYQTKYEFGAGGERLPVNEVLSKLLQKEITCMNGLRRSPFTSNSFKIQDDDLIPF